MIQWMHNVIMATLCNRAGRHIFVLRFLLLFFLAYSQPLQIGCLPYFHTCCGLSANLKCRSEVCCTRLAENIGCKNSPSAHCTNLSGYILQLRHVSTLGKKLVKQQYLLHMFSQYGELRPISSWDWFTSLGHPSKFQCVSGLGFVRATTLLNGGQPNFVWCLAISWAATLYIPPNGIFSTCKIHFLSKSCILLYLQHYCTALE